MLCYRKNVFSVILLLFCHSLQAIDIQRIDTTIVINTIGGLQYDLIRFKVKPGTKVKIVLKNKDDMVHNFLITSPKSRPEVVDLALRLGKDGEAIGYVPASPKVLWSINTLSPGEVDSLIFTSPLKEGIYPYVCTYPGHGSIMFGAMYVTNGTMPKLEEDLNVPLQRRTSHFPNKDINITNEKIHPFKQTPPYLYRIFVPNASPAAINVRLPSELSYCWDANVCRLRYAWKGGFLDNTDIWKGHYDSYSEIMGTVFYHDKMIFPIHFDKPGNIPKVQFKGYKLIDRYPEFHYILNGVDVYELIKSNKDGSALIRTFRMPNNNRKIWFVVHNKDGISYQSSNGKWKDGFLELSPAESHQFTIIMNLKNDEK